MINITITILWTIHPIKKQDILQDDSNDKHPLISESVTVIWIGVHPAGEEPDQHVIRMAPRVSRMTTVHKVPTRLKSGLYSRDEILVPDDHPAQPSSWATSFSLH
jgi:hypothetical protein